MTFEQEYPPPPPGPPPPPSLSAVASTGTAGYQLAGAGTILSWTAPSDGQLHRVMVLSTLHVSVLEVGGAIGLQYTAPDGTASATIALYAGGIGVGLQSAASLCAMVEAGTTVSLVQSTALTVGTALLWAELWGL